MLQTVKVTFARNFNPNIDTAYTYQTEDDVEVGQLVWVKTNQGPKKVKILSIDEEFDKATLARFGSLAYCYVTEPLAPRHSAK